MKIVQPEPGTVMGCWECDKPKVNLAELGEPLGEDSCTAWVCLDCLRKAVALLEDHERSKEPPKPIERLPPRKVEVEELCPDCGRVFVHCDC